MFLLGLLSVTRSATVFSPTTPASDVLTGPNACIHSQLPFPMIARRPALTHLQAFDADGNARCRIKRHYLQVGSQIRVHSIPKTRKEISVTGTVVYCSGPNWRNWHHWLLEILPSAFHAARNTHVSVLAPNELKNFPNHLDALGRAFTDSEVRFIHADEVAVADNIRISSWWLSCKIPNTKGDRSQDMLLAREYIDALTRDFEAVPGSGPRVFLTRGSGQRRPYNQDACLEVAQEYGFTAVDTGMMTFAQQVATLSEAEVVVGPTGAAMANLLFARPGARAVVIGRQTGFTHWDRIADIRSLVVHGLPWVNHSSDTVTPSDTVTRSVDLGEFQQAIRKVV